MDRVDKRGYEIATILLNTEEVWKLHLNPEWKSQMIEGDIKVSPSTNARRVRQRYGKYEEPLYRFPIDLLFETMYRGSMGDIMCR